MDDRELIHRLGGTVAVAKICGVTSQAVSNWLTRGIPPKQKIDHPELFLFPLLKARMEKPQESNAVATKD